MLTNVEPLDSLRGIARHRTRTIDTKTVQRTAIERWLQEGWEVEKKNRKSVRLKKPKPPLDLLQQRVWSLFYRLAFDHLTGELPSELVRKNAPEREAIPIVAIGEEIAVAVRCFRNDVPGRLPRLGERARKFAELREGLARASNAAFGATVKRTVVMIIFTENVIISDADATEASSAHVTLFDSKDLEYYETLVSHLGPAAKYQLLADTIPGKQVPGLEIRVPAVKSRIGGSNCYTFSISPEYLLKIAYVSHRSKGKASDVHTYQRMLSRGRLNRIREYIDNDGVFPTNIVINLDSKRIQFERAKQQTGNEEGLLGWLDVRPTYKSAWIIDGQHRLFSYSGHPRAATSRLAVLAFEGLPPSKQAALFIDINAKQKSVKQSLLQELYAELHWDADAPQTRVRAIISKAIQSLDANPESPLYARIQASDVARDDIRCISFTSIFGALERSDLFIAKERKGDVIEYGALWGGGNVATLRRTTRVMTAWLAAVRDLANDWWDKGAGEGGGLAMNDGVVTSINVLKSVLPHIESQRRIRLLQESDERMVELIAPYGAALGEYFRRMNDTERKAFRDLRGNQGLAKRLRRAQEALRQVFPDFEPEGLDQFLDEERTQTNVRAKAALDRIERALQRGVVDELKREYDDQWWTLGIPKKVRKKAGDLYEEDDGRRGGREYYFDFIDYRDIAQHNWTLFESMLGLGSSAGKDKRTAWLVFVNDKRRIVSHASSGASVSVDDLATIEQYERWLSESVGGQDERSDT
ncbi:MAG TPA: DGQHR domain-containing protein [Thermoanaerobaculia bacterium]|nr:DGQHR domain-containing protein [Thermoanaerobaculia bacterium]